MADRLIDKLAGRRVKSDRSKCLGWAAPLHDRELCRRRVPATEGRPVVGNEPGTDDVASPIDSPRHKRHLKEGGELVQLLDGAVGAYLRTIHTQRECKGRNLMKSSVICRFESSKE
eukprot:scaffold676261_cov64-Prasinocladus_malaysianus.AAC.1